MPKSGKGFIRVIKAKKPKSKKSRKVRKQRGGRVTMPGAYFDANHTAHYASCNGSPNLQAVSQGTANGTTDSVGPNLVPNAAFGTMKGGGVLPAEYFGGNSGRYFAAGSPELQNCTHAYGVNFPSSHGVVMPGENANFMGPNLGVSPNWLDMTGGSRRKRRSTKKSKSKKQRKTSSKKSRSKKGKKGRK
jgi:hypothetical protein